MVTGGGYGVAWWGCLGLLRSIVVAVGVDVEVIIFVN